jgi:hypothetical protein
MELLGRELGTHWADFGNVEPNPNRTMPWSGRRLLSTRAIVSCVARVEAWSAIAAAFSSVPPFLR